MITREQAKEICIESLKKDMEAQSKSLDDICLISPKKGRDSWTFRECLEALEQDKCLEDSGINQIDTVLNYEKYLNEQGRSLLDKK